MAWAGRCAQGMRAAGWEGPGPDGMQLARTWRHSFRRWGRDAAPLSAAAGLAISQNAATDDLQWCGRGPVAGTRAVTAAAGPGSWPGSVDQITAESGDARY